jgi:hypothetical protein
MGRMADFGQPCCLPNNSDKGIQKTFGQAKKADNFLFTDFAARKKSGRVFLAKERIRNGSRRHQTSPAPFAERWMGDRQDCHFAANAASMASVTSFESGFVAESQRLRIFPSLLTRNLPKFHFTSPGNGESLPESAA